MHYTNPHTLLYFFYRHRQTDRQIKRKTYERQRDTHDTETECTYGGNAEGNVVFAAGADELSFHQHNTAVGTWRRRLIQLGLVRLPANNRISTTSR